MGKVRLNLDALRVESFDTVDEMVAEKQKARGTVQGYYTQITCPQTQCGNQCASSFQPCYDTMRYTDGDAACACPVSGDLDC